MQENENKSNTFYKVFYGIGFTIIIVGAVIAVVFWVKLNNLKPPTNNNNRDAWVCTQKVVKDNLKSPSTAKFCNISEVTFSNTGNDYTVEGWVDATNSFNATIRTKFIVKLTLTKTGYTNASCVLLE